MPITSASEFEAVLGQAMIKIDKTLYQSGGGPRLQDARRLLEQVAQSARDASKLKDLRARLEQAADTVRSEISHDEALGNDLWDLMDYIDFRC